MTATKTILVTGAVGFIGTNLVEALLQRGDHVIALDAMDNYYDPALKATNLESLRGSVHAERLTFVQGDVRNEALIERLLRDHRFDAVAHLAALAGVRASLDEPTRYVDVNVNGTLVMLEAARHVEPSPNLVLASTSSVYGTSGQVPFVETDVADRPLAPYPASKRAAELMGHSYHHVYGLDFTALRLFTAYGPRNRPDMMAFRLLDSIFKGTDVQLYDGGELQRDWTYVGDIVAGIVTALDRRLGFEIINLGRGEPLKLSGFVEHIKALTGEDLRISSVEAPPTEIAATHADLSKARQLLGYYPQTTVEEGLAQLIEWYERDRSITR